MSSKQKIILIISLLFCSIIFSLPLIRSGLVYDYGIGFWGPSGHDMIWHLQLINRVVTPLKIDLASFSGQPLQNYHPFYDILIAYLSKITSINSSLLVFQIFPLVSSLIYLYLAFIIGYKLTGKYYGGLLLIFIQTFSGSFGWVVTLFQNLSFSGESIFWSMQPASFQTNPPLVLSLIMIELLILQILNNRLSLITILLLSLIPITKVYGGLTGYLLIGLFSLVQIRQRDFRSLKILLISLPLTFLIFLSFNKNSSTLINWQPFWFVQQLFSSIDRIYIPRVSSALYNYLLSGSLKSIPLLLFGTIIFLLGNLGWRIIGFFHYSKKHHQILNIFTVSCLILITIPLLFTQKGTSWNTIQFFYYAIFLSGILLNQYFVESRFKYKILLVTIFIISSLLGNIGTYKNYLGNPAPAFLDKQELNAIEFLNNQPKGLILTLPYNKHFKDKMSAPVPLYAYETNAYLGAYTKHDIFLADEMNLNNSGYPWQSRLSESLKFFEQNNIHQDRGFLVNNLINYIYLTGRQLSNVKLGNQNLYLQEIYSDGQTLILKVLR